MKRIDVEALLQWAVNDELPKGQHVMANVVRTIEQAGKAKAGGMAQLVRQHHFDDGGAVFVPGEPARDAVMIAKAVQRFEVSIGLHDEAAAHALLGPLAALDPLAVPTALAMRVNVGALMLSCAVLKRRPLLRLEAPRPQRQYVEGDRRRSLVLRYNVDGELVIAPASRRSASDLRSEMFYGEPRSPLKWDDPSVCTIAVQRTEYTIWWRALALLQTQLAGLDPTTGATLKVRDHEVLPLSAPAEPWHTPQEAARPALKTACETPARKLPLKPERPLTGPPPDRRRPGSAIGAPRIAPPNAREIAA